MAIEGFSPSPSSPSPPPYYQLLERSSARLGRVKKGPTFHPNLVQMQKILGKRPMDEMKRAGFSARFFAQRPRSLSKHRGWPR